MEPRPDDLVLSSGTVENPPIDELAGAAAAGGYAGVTLWPSDYHPGRRHGEPPGQIRAKLEDRGLYVQDVDAHIAWVGPNDPGPPYMEEIPERETFELAEAVGARGVNVLLHGLGPADLDASAEVFAGVCDRAAEHGLRAHLEFSRNRVYGRDLPEAAEIARATGRPNAGLMLDVWHVHFGRGSFADLEKVDGERITGVQLSDVPHQPPENLGYATRYARLAPGEGALDLVGFLSALRAGGCRAPLSLEVFDAPRAESRGTAGFARDLAEATRRLQNQAGQD
ncbi:MAG: sugar phosphate isomerase/epimerase [Proteobacteria bacterium]|nr:sugar phosphate isomerase/epimerase [Pseudomonadota bacterium]